MTTMILPTRMAIAVAEACNVNVLSMPVFMPNGDDLARMPMGAAVQMTRALVAQEDRARHHHMLEQAAKARKE
jgi:hypothetical protein